MLCFCDHVLNLISCLTALLKLYHYSTFNNRHCPKAACNERHCGLLRSFLNSSLHYPYIFRAYRHYLGLQSKLTDAWHITGTVEIWRIELNGTPSISSNHCAVFSPSPYCTVLSCLFLLFLLSLPVQLSCVCPYSQKLCSLISSFYESGDEFERMRQ